MLLLTSLLTAPTGGTSVVTIIYVLTGLLAIGGAGGAIGLYRWAKNQGVRDSKVDLMIAAVLPDTYGKGGINARFEEVNHQLQEIRRDVTPNGGQTQMLGDIAQRTERTVDALKSGFDTHVGESHATHVDLDRRLTILERKP